MSSEQQQEHGNHGEPSFAMRIIEYLPDGIRRNVKDIFQPEDVYERIIPGEEVQLEIGLAWYRDIFGHFIFHYFRWVLVGTVVITAVIAIVAFLQGFPPIYAVLPFIIWLAMVAFGAFERFEYSQWRLLKTNARLIISVPQHGAWPLVDNIELQAVPSVLDTNWSPNPVWRVFQFFTGARDLYISLAGYQFVEGTARVRDALVIPDVMPDDVHKLKTLVFIPN